MRWIRPLAVLLALACGGDKASAQDQASARQAAAEQPAQDKEGKPVGDATAAPAEPPPGTASFSADAAQPYFLGGTGPAAVAAAHFAIEEWQPARDGFAAWLASQEAPTDAVARARVGYLIAICDSHLGRWAEAAAGFDAATVALPALADYTNYEAARAYYFAHDLDAAADRAARVTKGALREPEARLLAGDLLRARGKWKQVAQHYEQYLADYPKGMRRSEARYHLGEAYEKLKRAVPDALVVYRQITIEDPIGAWNARAAERVAKLLKQVGKKQRKAYQTLTADEHIARGKQYFDGMRNPESMADFRAALGAKGLTAETKCEAAYLLGQSTFKNRTRCVAAPLLEDAAAICASLKNDDKEMRARYQAGRGYLYCHTNDGYRSAIAALAKAEAARPEHSMADDARLRQAEAWSRLDPQTDETRAKVEELLAGLPTVYPEGDMRAEALWRLAWRDWKEQKYEAAIGWLDKEIAAMPHDDNWWGEGQAHYWKARAFEKLGDQTKAVESYLRAVREYPLGYYALHALNRLRESYPAAFDEIVVELKQLPKTWPKDGKNPPPAFTFKPRAVYAEAGFARALELLRLGLGDAAQAELERLGLEVPDGRKKVTDPDQAELLWAVALLYDRARRYDKSHWIARWSVLDYKDAWPTAANRARWEIAYPKAFWHLVEPAAKALQYPPELLIAHIREESAFDPLQESFANAIGLTQMINSTGTRFAKGLGFPATRENLRDPAKNVAVGSRFLGYLWTLFDGGVGLTVPAYNAGEGAVWKWLCQWGGWAQDEYAEQIPADEARGYSKRVLNSYFIYSYLENGTIPVLSNVIPAAAINQQRCKKQPDPE